VLLAGLGVVLLSGVTTAVLAVSEVSKVVEALRQSKRVKLKPNVLAPTSRGAPQTLLLVGNDERPAPKYNPFGKVLPHSNEMLLVRIDPSKPTISMLSIPRELQVTFTAPNGQVITNRINSAYTYGGIELMTKTVKQLLGVSVNHVLVVTFPKFRRAVDEMGCVYMTVDRRYYHVNEPGGEQYFEINLQPGYQRMCGRESLEFVANRHEDTSVTRDARDQRFLLETKAQYGGALFENRGKFEHTFGRAVETDIHETGQVLDLLALLVEAQGKPVRQVPFHATLLQSYDTATPRQISESVSAFLGGTAPIPKYRLGQSLRSVHSHAGASRPPLPTLAPTEQSVLAHARSLAPSLPFALEYPRFRHPYGASGPDTLRRYAIRDPQGRLHPSYVVAVQAGELGRYYDVQGTSWTEPPLLANPSQEIRAGSRTYDLYYVGEQLRTVAWREGSAAYWIQNTLTNDLSPREMLALAEQTVPVVSVRSRPTASLSLRTVTLPSRPGRSADVATKIGAGFGFAGLAALLVLAWRALLRGRELGELRAQVARAMALEAQQRSLLAASAAPAAPAAAAPRSIYSVRGERRKRTVAVSLALLAALIVGVGTYLLLSGSSRGALPARAPHAAPAQLSPGSSPRR
jgi:LCP family protein required for cell wall assembly